MPLPLAAAIGAGLLKGGLNLFGQIEARKAAKEQQKLIKGVVGDIEEQEAKSSSQFQSRLNTILSRAAMEQDPQKAGLYASIYAGTTQAREMEKQQLASQKRQVQLQSPVTPGFNIIDVLGNIATGAISGAELGLNVEEFRKDAQFKDKMRELFLGELDLSPTSDLSVPSANSLVGAGLRANQGAGLTGLTNVEQQPVPFFGRGFIQQF